MITGVKIDLGEYSISDKLIKEDINVGERVLVFDSDHIERSVDHTHA